MATKGERQALLFLTTVALLGAGARFYRAGHRVTDTTAIDHQIAAVVHARTSRPTRKSKPGRATDSATAVEAIPPARAKVDLDHATANDIEGLPGLGPALASRILAEREAHGPFGCLAALDAVKGIGPAMLRRLDSLVQFSGPPRASCPSGDLAGPAQARR